ncbi:putative xyloglucan endotransglucosylase/hydrolase protein 1 [Phragmites australis]|uniref:putative xyloglucan endotransglucosylase/hydrolase protein 1 n=1 Tax=Phragmites australis TaxID=29695 RepID=UPI002D79D06C|nr:putative xyloglucan endotransglucosylase/hydrolase protein 1 [Phragmites australis]
MALSKACPWLLLLPVFLAAVAGFMPAAVVVAAAATAFDDNYVVQWGNLVNQGTEVDLTMDQSSGGAGFRSKSMYGSGFFHMRMKLPSGFTAGVVTTFYLTSQPENDGEHDELDFEFLGDKDGKPITLQTNVFVNGHGDREQRLHLWFDPAADFHDYKILWNPYQLVMFVDDTPIRVLRNLTGSVPGYEFPAKQTMLIRASIWDGSDWATDGGQTKVDWSKAPFTAGYKGFDVDACANSGATPCDSPALWWNAGEYRSITDAQRAAYEGVKEKYMNYNFCTDKTRFNNHMPPECDYD